MSRPVRPRGITPAQTVGPFLSIGLPWKDGSQVVPPATPDSVLITGLIFDGDGEVVPDGLVETWQADPDGRFPHPDDPRGAAEPKVPGFRGFGRSATDSEGRYEILTVKPGSLPGPDGEPQAPHLDVSVFARGLLHRLVTRIYFPDEEAANAADPVLSSIGEPALRDTLIATNEGDHLRFDIHLQGADETVFFAV